MKKEQARTFFLYEILDVFMALCNVAGIKLHIVAEIRAWKYFSYPRCWLTLVGAIEEGIFVVIRKEVANGLRKGLEDCTVLANSSRKRNEALAAGLQVIQYLGMVELYVSWKKDRYLPMNAQDPHFGVGYGRRTSWPR